MLTFAAPPPPPLGESAHKKCISQCGAIAVSHNVAPPPLLMPSSPGEAKSWCSSLSFRLHSALSSTNVAARLWMLCCFHVGGTHLFWLALLSVTPPQPSRKNNPGVAFFLSPSPLLSLSFSHDNSRVKVTVFRLVSVGVSVAAAPLYVRFKRG